MTRFIRVPIKKIGNEEWGDLNALAISHEITGERVDVRDYKHSSAGGHRVRLYHFKKNVLWRYSTGMELSIIDVDPAEQPQPRRRGR